MTKVLADIEKPNGEVIRIQLNEFNEKYYLDIRIHYISDEDEYKPTKKGVSIPVELYEELKDAITNAEDEIADLDEAGDDEGGDEEAKVEDE